MGNAREPDIIEDPVATETAHVFDVYIFGDGKMRDPEDLVDVAAKTVTMVFRDEGSPVVTKTYTGVDVSKGLVRFTLGAAHFATAGAYESQLYIDGLLINEYQGEFTAKLA